MSIQATLEAALKDAMRSKDTDRLACIRQIKSRVQEAVNDPEFTGETDDALYQQVIGSYVKALKKGIKDFATAGARGQPLVTRYQAEIAYLRPYLPPLLDEAATRTLVEKAIADLHITDPKHSGKVLGALMQSHPDRIDVNLAKRLAKAVLG